MTTYTQRNADIVNLARAGVPYSKIGALFGIGTARAHAIARQAGISRDPRKGPHLTAQGAYARADRLRDQARRLVDEAEQLDVIGLELERGIVREPSDPTLDDDRRTPFAETQS